MSNIEQHETVGERTSLAMPLELEEGSAPSYARAAIFLLCALVFSLLLWANFATVRELSMAPGEIVPDGPMHSVSHREGGVVAEIFVRDGDIVEAGTPIVRLRAETAGGELEQFQARQASMQISAERLSAQLEDRLPDYSSFDLQWTDIINEQQAVFDSTTAEQSTLLNSLGEQLKIAESEFRGAAEALESKEDQLITAQEQFRIQEKLIETGYTSKLEFLEAKGDLARAQDDLAEANERKEKARRDIDRLKADYDNTEASYRTRLSTEKADIITSLAELEEPLQTMQYRSDNFTVRASTNGVVKKINVAGENAVVQPGDVIAEILPNDTQLLAEVRIDPKDIGLIVVDQETEVLVTAFDPNRFGKATGRVSYISPGTFIDEQDGTVYFLAKVELDGSAIGTGKYSSELSAGMTVMAEIITRKRSIMEYMLKPVVRSLDTSFSEG